MREKRTLAQVFSFDIKFRGTKKTQFYRKLFGYSTTRKTMTVEGKIKMYHTTSSGLLDRIPHILLGKSVFAVPINAAGKVKMFFSNPAWKPIELHIFTAILPNQMRLKAMYDSLYARMKIGQWSNLAEGLKEINEWATKGGKITPELKKQAELIIDISREIMNYDWSDGREFSKELEIKLQPVQAIINEET